MFKTSFLSRSEGSLNQHVKLKHYEFYRQQMHDNSSQHHHDALVRTAFGAALARGSNNQSSNS
jgi:hypothetical protein